MNIEWKGKDALWDMDGTWLDLLFDNKFWGIVLPYELNRVYDVPLRQARARVEAYAEETRGTLAYYCILGWGEEFNLNVAALHKGWLEHLAAFAKGAEVLLKRVVAECERNIIVTDASVAALWQKRECLTLAPFFPCFNDVISSEEVGMPKSDPRFWQALDELLCQRGQPAIDRENATLVDDTASVLTSAHAAGFPFEHLRYIQKPDSELPTRPEHEVFLSVEGIHCL